MAELLKNVFNKTFFKDITGVVKEVIPSFNSRFFIKQIYADDWEGKELKERMRHITLTLKPQMSSNFKESTAQIIDIIQRLKKQDIREQTIAFIFLPDLIEVYGINDYKTAMNAFEKITQFTTCEFAIRPFLIKYPGKGMQQMLKWSKHKHPMVRRLSSEGCRPRLPWAMALPMLKKDPGAIIPILEILKNDESESVRRSVANNLNDISKDHPKTVIKLAKSWQGKSKETDWLVKHACRTLLKQGNSEAMRMFGFSALKNIEIEAFKIHTPQVKIGDALAFSFQLANKSKRTAKIRLEYGLYYQKANGTLSKKVFSISEKDYPPNSNTPITRKQSFKLITTRKFHLGHHQVSVIINGQEFEQYDFELIS